MKTSAMRTSIFMHVHPSLLAPILCAIHLTQSMCWGTQPGWHGRNPDDVSLVAVSPVNGSIVVCSDVSTYLGNDGSSVWQPTSGAAGVSRLYASTTGSFYAIASGSLLKLTPPAKAWTTVASGSISFWAQSPDGSVQGYLSSAGGTESLYRRLDGGGTWSLLTSNVPASEPVGFAIVDQKTFIVNDSSSRIVMTSDAGLTFSTTGQLCASPLMGLLVDRTNPRRIFAGTYSDGLYLSTDGGQSWARSSAGVPQGYGVSKFVQASDGAFLALVFNSQEALGFFRSVDGGASWENLCSQMPFPER